MLPVVKMKWNDCSDPRLGYYKNNSTKERWICLRWTPDMIASAVLPLFTEPVQHLFKCCVKELDPPVDDPSDEFKMRRFVLMDREFVSRLRVYIGSQGHEVRYTATEIYDAIQWGRAVCEELKYRVYDKPGVWNDILGRAACSAGRWGNISNNPEIKQHIESYIKNHGRNRVHQGYLNNPKAFVAKVDENNLNNTQLTKITNDSWMQIKWLPAEAGSLIVCPTVLFLKLGLKLGKIAPNILGDEDMCSPKDPSSLTLCKSTNIKPLFNSNEIHNVIQLNKSASINNDVMLFLLNQISTMVCCFCFILAHKIL